MGVDDEKISMNLKRIPARGVPKKISGLASKSTKESTCLNKKCEVLSLMAHKRRAEQK